MSFGPKKFLQVNAVQVVFVQANWLRQLLSVYYTGEMFRECVTDLFNIKICIHLPSKTELC